MSGVSVRTTRRPPVGGARIRVGTARLGSTPRARLAAPLPGDGRAAREAEHVIDRLVADIEHGRFERSLSGLTAVAAVVTAVEIYLEHYRAGFGNKWMWSPILATPPVVVAGVAGVFSRRWAKTALPIASLVFALDGLLGEYFHARGVGRKPGGWRNASYNVPTGPPISAPGLMCMVGGMGVLAALLRRER